MTAEWDAILIHPDDTVAVALRDLQGQVQVRMGDETLSVALTEPIPMGHKLAMRPITEGELVRKYGEVIGAASQAIAQGGHVHTHNLASRRAAVGVARREPPEV